MNGKDTHVRGIRVFSPKPFVFLSSRLSLLYSLSYHRLPTVSTSRTTCCRSDPSLSSSMRRFDETAKNDKGVPPVILYVDFMTSATPLYCISTRSARDDRVESDPAALGRGGKGRRFLYSTPPDQTSRLLE